MRTLIADYLNRPGHHCGSSAMRNLLGHYCGLDLGEEEVFGLGSGIDCLLIEDEAAEPAVVLFGRGVTLEVDAARALGVDYREQIEPDDAKAWEDVRAEVVAGRPTMLTGDVFYLEYREAKVHFPAHRFVLVGFDDAERQALISDRVDPEPQSCSYEALARSRNPRAAMSTFNLWGRFHDTRVAHTREEAYRSALELTARRMLGEDSSQADLLRALTPGRPVRVTTGLAGLRAFAERLPTWRDRPDMRKLTSYAAGCMEKFGTGGGNFRRMYATFLRGARQVVPERVGAGLPELAERSAASWTELSGLLHALSRAEEQRDSWPRCAELAAEILSVETDLFTGLAEAGTTEPGG